jgi:hypothetical protein
MSDETEGQIPEIGEVVDLVPASLPHTYLCWVDDVRGGQLLVTAPVDPQLHPVTLRVGERIDLLWRHGGGLRCLPVELVDIEPMERPRWRLAPAGVVQRGQRRDAVRAPITAPVSLEAGPATVRGTAVDVSEGGLRCVLEREQARPGEDRPAPPAVGDVVRLAVTLGDVSVRCLAEVARQHPRDDGRAELSLRFIGLTEHEQDRIRERVFASLRDLRRRGLI